MSRQQWNRIAYYNETMQTQQYYMNEQENFSRLGGKGGQKAGVGQRRYVVMAMLLPGGWSDFAVMNGILCLFYDSRNHTGVILSMMGHLSCMVSWSRVGRFRSRCTLPLTLVTLNEWKAAGVGGTMLRYYTACEKLFEHTHQWSVSFLRDGRTQHAVGLWEVDRGLSDVAILENSLYVRADCDGCDVIAVLLEILATYPLQKMAMPRLEEDSKLTMPP